jgi:hypothetical protein
MNEENQKFENFLRGFEPRLPRPLPVDSRSRYDWGRLVAAAMILTAVGASLSLVFRSPRARFADQHPAMAHESSDTLINTPMMSSPTLTRAALADRGEFDIETNHIAPGTLPRFDRTDSSLRALAKE